MKATICPHCKTEHWSRQPCPSGFVMPSVTKHVAATAKPAVRAGATDDLTAEIKMLKRKLAEAHAQLDTMRKSVDTTVASTECPACTARREAKTAAQRKWRAAK